MASSSAAPPTMVSAVEATRPSRPSAHLSLIKQVSRARTSYVLLAPFFLLFSTFVVIPIVLSGYLSLQDYSGTKAPVFIGLENFAELMSLDIKPLPQATDKTSGELLYKCGTKQVPQSQADQLRASGASCTAVMARPGLVLAKGYQELARFVVPFTNTMLIIGASDTRFWISLWNTIKYSLVVVPIGIYLGLALALVLQRQNPLNFFLRTVFFLPSVTSTLAVITIWRYIFNSDSYGLANGFLTSLSFPKQTFLADATWTVPVMIIFALWGGVGYNMLLFLAGLQSIPRDYYDAAAIDGASVEQRFTKITLPLLRPTLLYVLVTGTISSLQVFDIVYVLFSTTEHVGGVLDSGLTVVPYLYEEGFKYTKLGYASSLAWILFLLIFVLTLVNLKLGRINEVD